MRIHKDIPERIRGISKIGDAEQPFELRGFNPQRREQVSRLRVDAHVEHLKSKCSEDLASEVLRESIDCADNLHKKWSTIDMESQRLMQELSEAKVMLGKTMRLSAETNASMESVRWETRQVSSLEDQIAMDTMAQELIRTLPESIRPCSGCHSSRVPVSVCRIVNGHSKDLTNPRRELVDLCHLRYWRKLENQPAERPDPNSAINDLLSPFEARIQEPVAADDLLFSLPDMPWLAKLPAKEKESRLANFFPETENLENPLAESFGLPELTKLPTSDYESATHENESLGKTSMPVLAHSSTKQKESSRSSASRKTKKIDIPFSLNLKHVHGYSGKAAFHNVVCLASGDLVYTAGSVCVVHDIASNRQRLFTGHTDLVLSIAKHPHETFHVIASGQGGPIPAIFLWNCESMVILFKIDSDSICQALKSPEHGLVEYKDDTSAPKYLELQSTFAVRALDFSPDGKSMVTVFDDRCNTLAMYTMNSMPKMHPWTSCRLSCAKSSGMARILAVKFNAFTGTFVTCGVRHVVFWKHDEITGFSGRNGSFGCEAYDATFCSLDFLGADRTLTGSSCGAVWLWSGLRLSKIIYDAHSGAVFDIRADGLTAVTAGQDSKLCIWNFAVSFESIPAGEIKRGDFLVREINAISALTQHGRPWVEHILSNGQLGPIRSIAWHRHSIYCGTGNNHLFSVDDCSKCASCLVLGHHGTRMKGLCWGRTVPWFVTAGDDSIIIVRDAATKETLAARNLDLNKPKPKKLVRELNTLKMEHRHQSQALKNLIDSIPCSSRDIEMLAMDQRDVTRKLYYSAMLPMSSRKEDSVLLKSNQGHNVEKLTLEQRNEIEKMYRKVQMLKSEIEVIENQMVYLDQPIGITCIDMSSDGQILAVGLNDGGFSELEIRFNKSGDLQLNDLYARIVHNVQRPTTNIKFSPDNKFLAVGYADGHLGVFLKETIEYGIDPSFSFKCNSSVTKLDWDRSCTTLRCNDAACNFYIFELNATSAQAAKSTVTWASSSCVLTWLTHAIYFDTFLHEDVLAKIAVQSKGIFVVSDVYGALSTFKLPCLIAGSKFVKTAAHCGPISLLAIDEKEETLLSAGDDFIILQWMLVEKEAQPLSAKASVAESNTLHRQSFEIETDTDVDLTFHSKHWHLTETVDRCGNIDEDISISPNLPWMTMCQPPKLCGEQIREIGGSASNFKLSLEHVHGYSGRHCRHNLMVLPSGELLYTVGSVCVLQNIREKKQRFYRGHHAFISALALHPHGTLVASGDGADVSVVCIWDSESEDWDENLLLNSRVRICGFHSRRISALSFSSGGGLLLSVGMSNLGTEQTIVVYAWEINPFTPLAIHSTSCLQQIFAACFNPYNDEIITCGAEHSKFWRLHGSVIEEIVSEVGNEFYDWAVHESGLCATRAEACKLGKDIASRSVLCIECLDQENVITGTIDGKIIVWRRHSLVCFIQSHTGPIFDIHCPRNRNAVKLNIEFKAFGEPMTKWWDRSKPSMGTFEEEIKKGMIVEHTAQLLVYGSTTRDANEKRYYDTVQSYMGRREKENIFDSKSFFEMSYTVSRYDPDEFVTGGKDGQIIFWSMEKELVVGFQRFKIPSIFKSFSSTHSTRSVTSLQTMTVKQFISSLDLSKLISLDNDGLSSTNPQVSYAEAVRIFEDVMDTRSVQASAHKELVYDEFVDALERVVGLINLKRYAFPYNHIESVERRQRVLESDLINLESSVALGHLAKDYQQNLIRIRSEIQQLSLHLSETSVSIKMQPRPLKNRQIDSNALEKNQSPTSRKDGTGRCIKAIAFHDELTVFIGTSVGEILEFNPVSKAAVATVAHCPNVEVNSICQEKDGSNLLFGSSNGSLCCLNGVSREIVVLLSNLQGVSAMDCTLITSSSWTKMKSLIAIAYTGGFIEFRILDESLPLIASATYESKCISQLKFASRAMNAVNQLAVGYQTGLILVLTQMISDFQGSWQVSFRLTGLHSAVSQIEWSDDSLMLRAASESSAAVLVWAVHTERIIQHSEIADIEWTTTKCPFDWRFLGIRDFLSLHEKVIGKHIIPEIGQRVKRSQELLDLQKNEMSAADFSKSKTGMGTLIGICDDLRCVVAWDHDHLPTLHCASVTNTPVVSRPRIGASDINGIARYDLVLAIDKEKELETLDCCESHIGEKLIAFASTSGVLYIAKYPCFRLDSSLPLLACTAQPGEQMHVNFSHKGNFAFTFSKNADHIMQWKCSVKPSRNSVTLHDILIECKHSVISVCLLDCLVSLRDFGDEIFHESTANSFRAQKRFFEILQILHKSFEDFKNLRAHAIQTKKSKSSSDMSVKPTKQPDVFERLHGLKPPNAANKNMQPLRRVEDVVLSPKPISTRSAAFQRYRLNHAYPTQSKVQLTQSKVQLRFDGKGILNESTAEHFVPEDFSRQKYFIQPENGKTGSAAKSRSAPRVDKAGLSVPTEIPIDGSILESLDSEFTALAPYVFSSLVPEQEYSSNVSNQNKVKSDIKRRKQTYEEAKNQFGTLLQIEACDVLTYEGYENVLCQNPDVAVSMGLHYGMINHALYQFNFDLNKNVASPVLVERIQDSSKSMYKRRHPYQVWKAQETLVFRDYIAEFCDEAVLRAYDHLHSSEHPNYMLEDAKSVLNLRLMPLRGPEEFRLSAVTNQPSIVLPGSTSTLFNDILRPEYRNICMDSETDNLTEKRAIELLQEIGLNSGSEMNLTLSDFVLAVQSNRYLARKLLHRKLTFSELLKFLTPESIPKQEIGLPNCNMNLIHWQPEHHKPCQPSTSKHPISSRSANYIFDMLDSDGNGYITHAEFIKGLRLHAHIALKLGLPQHIRQADGSRELYQEMFMKMDPSDSKKIYREPFMRYFCVSKELEIDSDPLPNTLLCLTDPNSVYLLSRSDAERAFHYLDFPCSGILTPSKFQVGLVSYPALARRLGMPTQFIDQDGSRQFFEIVFGYMALTFPHIGCDGINIYTFSDYFMTKLEDRTKKFFRPKSVKFPPRVKWLEKQDSLEPVRPRYWRHAAVQATVGVQDKPKQVIKAKSPGLLETFRAKDSLPIRSKYSRFSRDRKADKNVEQSADFLALQAEKKSSVDNVLGQAAAASLELVLLAQKPHRRIMSPDKEAQCVAVIAKIALSCLHPGPVKQEHLEQVGEKAMRDLAVAKAKS